MSNPDTNTNTFISMPKQQLQAERIRFLYHQANISLIGHLLASFGVAYVFIDYISLINIILWYSSMLLIASIRFASVYYFKNNEFDDKDVLNWGWFFTLMVFLTGCVWGSASFIFILYDHPYLTLFMVMVITGILVASVASLSVFMWAYFAFAIPAGSPFIYKLAIEGSDEYTIYSLLITAFILAQMAYARVNQKTIDQSITLRNENMELIDKLKNEKKYAEKLRMKAESANIAKTKFLASASHDLRQPLHAMSLFLDVLEEQNQDSKQAMIVDMIKKSSHSLENLLESLLDISKLDAGIISVNKKHFSIQKLFDILTNEFNSIAIEKGLSIHFMPTSLCLNSDVQNVERILRNLISNAIRYTEQGKILIGCRRRKNSVLLSVYDTGVGIDADKNEIIFEEFQQLDNPGRDRSKGLGLGLSIVHRLAELLSAKLSMQSIPGKGSVFSIELPRCSSNQITQQNSVNVETYPKLADKTIVIIEDEEEIRHALKILISGWGSRVIEMTSVNDVTKKMHPKNKPDMILADYRLQNHETGVNIIHSIYNFYKDNKIPAIIITGDTAPDRIIEAKKSGFQLLHKPLSGGKLRALLNSVLLSK